VVIADTGTKLEVPGHLAAQEDRRARLGAPVEGRVLEARVRIEDRVTRRRPLVTLHSREASAAKAEFDKGTAALGSQRAQAAYARAARERAERLLAIKAAAKPASRLRS
jgi:multidrug efflux pump subunit AcrA (membrane-fusion protein)